MMTEEELTTLWHKVHAEGSSNHRGDVRRLIDEVRRLQSELRTAEDTRLRLDAAIKQLTSESLDMEEERAVLRARVIELKTAIDHHFEKHEERDADFRDLTCRYNTINAERDALLSRVTELEAAINEYCEQRNRWGGLQDHTPYGEAIDELHRISRESGYRPRWTAESVEESGYQQWRLENGLTKEVAR